MAAETQYTANTAIAVISLANSNLDGVTGNYYTVVTAPPTGFSGTLVKTVTIKAQVTTSRGMVRLFEYDGSAAKIIAEVPIPAVTQSSTDPTFETTILLNYKLEPGHQLWASTQIGNTFNIIAEALDFKYYTSSVRPESTKYTANTGMATISTANSNLDGAGTLGTVLTAASGGTQISSVVIKAQGDPSMGMVRLFLFDESTTALLTEIQVPAVTKSATAHSFSRRIDFGGRGFALKAGWILKASTENANTFNVIAEGLDWTYPA